MEGNTADKLNGRNINVSFTNNSNVPIEVLVFMFYSQNKYGRVLLYRARGSKAKGCVGGRRVRDGWAEGWVNGWVCKKLITDLDMRNDYKGGT